MKIKKIIVALTIIALLFAAVGTCTFLADPGDSSDPVITLSYITDILKPGLSFKVVNLSKGQTLACFAGTEVILRMGKATIIATEKGGLADVTSGTDLKNGESMPSNHLLIVPLSDGRGIKAENDVIVMVKGDYTIK
ncbi:MAG: hypothetical protein IJQ50_07430 [Clostridia bacterium]|nr:hypothetical protein [Clostridia bacterium]